jgi:hypothetical protein
MCDSATEKMKSEKNLPSPRNIVCLIGVMSKPQPPHLLLLLVWDGPKA